MTTIIVSILIFGLAMLGLAAGVLAGREPIKGSCGGLACLKDVACDGCPHARGELTP